MLDTRAYSTVVFKSIDTEQRIIEGIASSPSVDHDGDILEPGGAEFSLPMPLLWQHRQDEPIGHVLSAHVTAKGITIRAQIAKGVSPRIDEVWALIKGGLVRGLSIGSRLVEFSRNPSTGGLNVKRWKWLETSAVTIPANQQASITLVKSLDREVLAVSGNGQSRSLVNLPGVSGNRNGHAVHQVNANISEQLTTARTTIAEKSTRLNELVQQEAGESGLSTEDAAERDTLAKDIRELHKSIDTLSALEMGMGIQARQVTPIQRPAQQTPKVEVVELAKGTRFARVAMAVAAGKGSISDTLEYAKRWNGQTPEVAKFIKHMYTRAVEGTSVVESPGWGGELVYANNIASEFIELLRPATILGRISGWRTVPFNVRVARQSGGSTVNWVGEGNVKPVSELEFDTVTLPYHKIAGIVVLTEELVRLSSPSAEETVRRDLVEQIARFIDAQLITPSVSAGANNPASLTNGVSSPAASGTDADALYLDLNTALATFDDVDLSTEGVVILMTPALARGIATLRNALGQFEFSGMSATGGTLLGFPVIVSSSVPSGTIIILKPSEIFLADDGRVSLDASNQATLDMSGGSSPTFNLWQRNCIGIRAERWITWIKRRDESVAVIDTASYGPQPS